MKTKTFGISLILFLTFVAPVFAVQKDSVQYKNEIGLVITDLFDGSLQFSYERALGKNLTVKVGSAYKGENGLVNLSGLDRNHIKTSDLTYNGFKIIPEVRYYLKKTQLQMFNGFYFGAFLKYNGFQSDIAGTYINSSQKEYTLDFDVKLRIIAMGLMVGYKLPLSKRFSLDFLIAGPGQSWHNYSIKSNVEIPYEFYDDLNNALKNYSIYDLLHSDVRFKPRSGTAKFGMPTFRYSITLCFKL
jgi:hypothetical protein